MDNQGEVTNDMVQLAMQKLLSFEPRGPAPFLGKRARAETMEPNMQVPAHPRKELHSGDPLLSDSSLFSLTDLLGENDCKPTTKKLKSLEETPQKKTIRDSNKGAGSRRRKKTPYVGGGAKAYKLPENLEFRVGLEKPIVELLRPGDRKLNPLQMQKFKDATQALQQMHTHILEPLTLYTTTQLYDLMASVAETWKNSGKTAWKKRIHKIKENSRYRKQPRKNTLDENELEEIAELEKKIRIREEWEKKEKAKLDAEKERRNAAKKKRTRIGR
eukprot:CAMPEP_0184020330 /NCGR_PEP_ID=MMETSP0954-20121128/9289_1 /TAXON_ID=627963 /ORGANISM="Aplanochytrium sp, Strain PBS07" /LENGTH=272 /DNA_ID=CAMNT_0026302179 /DNA_START=283 /DNA_END=1101 /DNA_ORIENTATION=-